MPLQYVESETVTWDKERRSEAPIGGGGGGGKVPHVIVTRPNPIITLFINYSVLKCGGFLFKTSKARNIILLILHYFFPSLEVS
jgi:hypothetical protein